MLLYCPWYAVVWYRTLTTSNGWPTMRPAAPAVSVCVSVCGGMQWRGTRGGHDAASQDAGRGRRTSGEGRLERTTSHLRPPGRSAPPSPTSGVSAALASSRSIATRPRLVLATPPPAPRACALLGVRTSNDAGHKVDGRAWCFWCQLAPGVRELDILEVSSLMLVGWEME